MPFFSGLLHFGRQAFLLRASPPPPRRARLATRRRSGRYFCRGAFLARCNGISTWLPLQSRVLCFQFQQQPYPLLASAASGDDVEDGAAASALRQASHTPFSPKKPPPIPVYKDLHFNRDLSATKKLQAGVNLVARLVGVTLGPKGRNVVLSNKYGPPKIVNDGETVLKEIELEDPLENLGVKLVRKAGARMNDVAGDGCSTSIILAQGLITEGMKGIEKTASALVSELRLISQELCFFLTSLSSDSRP